MSKPDVPSLLLVEDDKVEAILIRRWLAGQYDVISAKTLAAASKAISDPDLRGVLLDLRLPDADGLQALEVVVGRRSDLPVIVLTGLEQEDLGPRCVEMGADDFLQKSSLSADNLRRTLGYALARRSAERFRLQLEHAQRLAVLGQLTAGVAHEVNNPASWVFGSIELALRHLDGSTAPEAGEVAELLKRALEGMSRIRGVVGDLLRFSRPESAAAEVVDLNRLVEGSCRLLHKEVAELADLELAPGQVPPIVALPGGLGQVVVNLVLNAMDAIRDRGNGRGTIRVETGADDGMVFFSVADDGCGMEPHVREQIFSPFYTTKDRRRGTGLGLSISCQIAAAHRGWIDVESAPGKGSRFVVRLSRESGLPVDLPRRRAHPAELTEPEKPLRVLLVDDEPMLLSTLKAQLEPRFQVVAALGGREALVLLADDDSFDAVICDLSMPDVDGPELFSRSPEELRGRFLFLSGGAFTQRLQAFAEKNQDRVLMKPVPLPSLEERLLALANTPRRGRVRGRLSTAPTNGTLQRPANG